MHSILLLFFPPQWFVIIGLNKIRTLFFFFKGVVSSTVDDIYCFNINNSVPYLAMSSCLGQDIERHEKEKRKRRGRMKKKEEKPRQRRKTIVKNEIGVITVKETITRFSRFLPAANPTSFRTLRQPLFSSDTHLSTSTELLPLTAQCTPDGAAI